MRLREQLQLIVFGMGAVALKTTANVLARGEHSHINRTRLLVGNLVKKTLFCGRGLNFLLGYQKRVLTIKDAKDTSVIFV